jgi:catechol 2,3-dioxygenase-like lactoylglutathione lyase family enzyme
LNFSLKQTGTRDGNIHGCSVHHAANPTARRLSATSALWLARHSIKRFKPSIKSMSAVKPISSLARLAEQGIEPERPPYSIREGGSRICFVRDPDGYRIELIERDD